MKKIAPLLGAMLLVLGIAGTASALSYSYDFSEFATEGQSFEGVTLDYMTLTSESGDLAYTNNYGGGLQANAINGNTSDRYLDFSAPIDFISVRGGDGGGDFDAFSLYLFDFNTDALIGRYDTPVFGGSNEPEWYTLEVSASNIGRVLFDPGNSGSLPGVITGIGGVVITDISYNTAPVPEPATMLLVGVGLTGLAVVRRRKKSRS